MPRKYSGPLQPGRRTAMVPRRRPRAKKPVTTKNITALIKRVSLAQVETKRSSSYLENRDIMHNITQYHGNFLNTTQGDGNPDGANNFPGQRIGNEIIAKALTFKLYLERQSSNSSTHFKVIVFKYPSHNFTLNDGNFWQGANGVGALNVLRIIDTIATNKITVLKQVIVRPNDVLTKELSFYIPLKNKKIVYNDNNSVTPKDFNIGLAVVGCDKIGDATTDQVGELNYAWKLTYKDP
jgi:hypothetical protein